MQIEQYDDRTFFIQGELEDPYMIFWSVKEDIGISGWTCDCMSFVFNIQHNGQSKDCKHIIACKEKIKNELIC